MAADDIARASGAATPLPIAEHADEILSAVRSSQVTIVCGETGSGKTTQIPQMLLSLGLGARGRRIAVTQPRRMATVAMAERVAAEMRCEVGGIVGYQHRFERKVSPDTRIKFMTDGVLLAETGRDPSLGAYDAIMIDEAHERSLNIDFLLGMVKRLLARRPRLRVVVSSATMDAEAFARFFGGAPVVRVPGRLYPVEVRYRAQPDGDEADLSHEVAAAVDELPAQGDVLVFLPGERDILGAAEVLRGRRGGTDEIIPLMASLPAAEQRRAFRLSARRRIVLATNVAETSVTIPGVRFVVDSGLARIPRYSHRTQVERLQVERISQASARQRAGRCGRVGPGVCVRLYSEEDFSSRDEYTAPEILRTSLAGTILKMLDLGLGDVAAFPFIDPPRPAMVREGMNTLAELGALAPCGAGDGPRLTPLGRTLARIPVEPRLARIMLAASRLAALPIALPVVAALACDDPRLRPAEERDKARAAHAKWRAAGSDFLSALNLWRWWAAETDGLSVAKARKLCKANYLSYRKMREWCGLERELASLAERLGLDLASESGGESGLNRALLAGLLGRIGRFDPEERVYLGAHGVRFALAPSSVLAKKPPEWIVAGEIVETARLMARTAAAIDVRWVEAAAGPLCRRSYRAPEWDARSGFVRALEQVTVHGLVVVPSRRCDYSRVDPRLSREIFIRFGLVGGAFPNPPSEVRANSALIGEMRALAEKTRRNDLFDEAALMAFFERAVPPGICSAQALRKWLKGAPPIEREAFALRRGEWLKPVEGDAGDFPDFVTVGGTRLALSYRHSPGEPETDGITCTVQRSEAAALRLWRAEWLVPGALAGRIAWMLAVLPSALRRALAPLDEKVAILLPMLRFGDGPLEDAVRDAVERRFALRIPPDAWRGTTPPPHLRVRYRITDDATGRALAITRDLGEALRAAGLGEADAASVAAEDSCRLHTAWDFPEGCFASIAEGHDEPGPSQALRPSRSAARVYKALHDENAGGVTLRLYRDKVVAEAEHAAGVTRLAAIALARRVKPPEFLRRLVPEVALFLHGMDYPPQALADDILDGAVREAIVRGRPQVQSGAEFEQRLKDGAGEVARVQSQIAGMCDGALRAAAEAASLMSRASDIPGSAAEGVRTQLAWLVFRGFPRLVPLARLVHYARYLKAARLRLERARLNAAGDRAKAARFDPQWARYMAALSSSGRASMDSSALAEIRWLIEEYRVSVFAQELKTAVPVSDKRLDARFATLCVER